MRRHKKWILAVLGVSLLALGALIFFVNREPTYQGRPLSAWVHDYSSGDYKKVQAAEAAIRAMGPEAIPYLTNTLAQRESLALRIYRKDILPKKLVEGLRGRIQWHSPVMESRNAALALKAVATNATDAIPSLVAALQDQSLLVNQAAVEALGKIGAPAVPALHERLRQTKTNTTESVWIIRALTAIGPPALPTAPDVVSFITNSAPDGDFALNSLISMGIEALPVVTNYFDHPSPLARRRVVTYLSSMGPKALPAFHLIEQAQQDPDPAVRLQAIYSVHAIRPPPERSRPIYALGLSDSNTNNILAAIQLLSFDFEGVVQNQNRLLELTQYPDSRIGLAASNSLDSFGAWPKK